MKIYIYGWTDDIERINACRSRTTAIRIMSEEVVSQMAHIDEYNDYMIQFIKEKYKEQKHSANMKSYEEWIKTELLDGHFSDAFIKEVEI